MLVTNLTDEHYKYSIDTNLIEECLNRGHYYVHRIGMHLEEIAHHCPAKKIIPFYNNGRHNLLLDVLRQIPIFLVSKQQCHKTLTVGYFGYKDDVVVPQDFLPNSVADKVEDVIDENPMKEDDSLNERPDCAHRVSTCIDLWGIYTREYPLLKNYSIDESHPRIFIWVDKIYDYVKGDDHNYRLLTTQVILHELAHAMMDINLIGVDHSTMSCSSFGNSFYTLKEESLAEAISLSLIKPEIGGKDWDWLVSVVKQQPFQYALGLEYLDGTGRVIERSVEEWINLKKCPHFSMKVVKEWIKYIYGKRPLDCKQLEILDEGMCFPVGLFRYPMTTGRFYSNHDVTVQVIKDYVTQNPSITRAELHSAFPDIINDDFEPIIDYPNCKAFHDKSNPDTRNIDDENVVDCADGKIAICDYWHPHTMDKFIANAAKLGISIEGFAERV